MDACTGGRMYGWTHAWGGACIGGRKHGWTHAWVAPAWVDACMGKYMHACMNGIYSAVNRHLNW
eukprot:272631-Chlamydomonas_euryale.AAC.2